MDLSDSEEVTAQSLKNSSSNLAPSTIKGWQTHLNEVKASGSIQRGCEPFQKLVNGKAKGSVMLFHGYSACPQQFEELSNLLVNKGYNVFVPLIPGHGKQPTGTDGKFVDDISSLPDVDSTGVYKNFAKNISAILKDESGIKVLGGLSLGGAIAARAMIENSAIYDRGFLMAPFFNAAGAMSVMLPALGEVIPNKKVGWGAGCEEQRRLGRAGYCNFKVTNVAAVRRFGMDTLKEISAIKKPMQITGVEKDPAASNSAISEAISKISNSKSCLFPKGANHSMLSVQDNVGVEMFWLKPLEEQIVKYVDTGKNFDVVGTSEHNLGLCKTY